jgi:hypothetical protein
MLELLQEASCALSANDADALERLLTEVPSELPPSTKPVADNHAAVTQTRAVLAAQVNAVAVYLALRERMQASTDREHRLNPWEH